MLNYIKSHQRLVVLIVLGAAVIYGIINRQISNIALKNSEVVEAEVTDIGHGRGYAIIYITYKFEGRSYNKQFHVYDNIFSKGDKIFIKVSRDHPGKYFDYVRKEEDD